MSEERKSVVDSLASEIVGELNPEELVLFPPTRDAFWAQGGAVPQGRRPGGIGFGELGPFATALTPIALAVSAFAVEALRDAAKEVMKTAGRDFYAAIKTRLSGPADQTIALPATTYSRLRAGIDTEARKYLSEDHADRLTNAVLARLAHRAE